MCTAYVLGSGKGRRSYDAWRDSTTSPADAASATNSATGYVRDVGAGASLSAKPTSMRPSGASSAAMAASASRSVSGASRIITLPTHTIRSYDVGKPAVDRVTAVSSSSRDV